MLKFSDSRKLFFIRYGHTGHCMTTEVDMNSFIINDADWYLSVLLVRFIIQEKRTIRK